MTDNLGWVLFVVAVVVIVMLYNKQNASATTTPDKDEVKCELRDAYGRLVTITGNANDPQFQNMCRYQQNQEVYLYGYPYYFVRYWSPFVWGGGGHRGGRGGHGGGHGGGVK